MVWVIKVGRASLMGLKKKKMGMGLDKVSGLPYEIRLMETEEIAAE